MKKRSAFIRFTSIRMKVFLGNLALCACFVFIFTYFSSFIMQRHLKDISLKAAIQTRDNFIKDINSYARRMEKVCTSIIIDPEVQKILNSKGKMGYDYIYSKLNSLMTANFQDIYVINVYDVTSSTMVSTLSGIGSYVNTVSNIYMKKALDKASDPNERKFFITEDNNNYHKIMGYASPIKYNYWGDIQGYAFVGTHSLHMESRISREKNYKESIKYVTDANGTLLFGDNFPYSEEVNLNEEINFNDANGYSFSKINGEAYVVVYAADSLSGFKYVELIPEKVIYAPLYQIVNIAYVIIALNILLGILYSFFFGKYISSPIISLKKLMEDYKIGGSRSLLEIKKRNDEFQYLFDSFFDMSKRIDMLVEKEYKAELAERELRLRYILEQLKPHFVFNVLDTIQWIMKLKNYEEGINSISIFSAYMRQVLQNSKNIITISAMAAELEDYIKLHKLLNDNFDYSISFDKELNDIKIPSFLLQPLAENIFNHAFKTLKKRGMITITGRLIDERIQFEIADNGHGMNEDVVEKIYESLDHGEPDIKNASFGIISCGQRLKLMFKEDFNIHIESKEDAGSKITICVPVKTGGYDAFK